MATIDISTKTVVRIGGTVANEDVLTLLDSGSGKEYVLSLASGVLTLTNIADDTEVITITVS